MPGLVLPAALAGLAVGALAHAAIEGLPRDESWRPGLPACRTCGASYRVTDVLPLMSWVRRNGRCRSCRTRMPSTGPFVEAINGLIWALLVAFRGVSPSTIVLMLLATALLVLAVIDLKHFLLPDVITLPGIVVGIAATSLPGWHVSFLESTLSAALGYFGMMLLAKTAQRYYGEEALGQGDWKMVAMLGAFLGSTKLMLALLVANSAGAAVGLLLVAAWRGAGRQKLPLGTFLGAAGILMVFF